MCVWQRDLKRLTLLDNWNLLLFGFFSGQVVYNVGLCICLYDITKLEDSYIFPGDGASHTKGLLLFFLAV